MHGQMGIMKIGASQIFFLKTSTKGKFKCTTSRNLAEKQLFQHFNYSNYEKKKKKKMIYIGILKTH
jgi:hypothetical protein